MEEIRSHNGNKKRGLILIAEDDPEMLTLLVDELTDAGYRVRAARDGVEAMAELSTQPVDLLITDMKMPRVDGAELLAYVQRRFPALPVVAISSFFDEQLMAGKEWAQVTAHFHKPLPMKQFKAAIHRSMAQQGGAQP